VSLRRALRTRHNEGREKSPKREQAHRRAPWMFLEPVIDDGVSGTSTNPLCLVVRTQRTVIAMKMRVSEASRSSNPQKLRAYGGFFVGTFCRYCCQIPLNVVHGLCLIGSVWHFFRFVLHLGGGLAPTPGFSLAEFLPT